MLVRYLDLLDYSRPTVLLVLRPAVDLRPLLRLLVLCDDVIFVLTQRNISELGYIPCLYKLSDNIRHDVVLMSECMENGSSIDLPEIKVHVQQLFLWVLESILLSLGDMRVIRFVVVMNLYLRLSMMWA